MLALLNSLDPKHLIDTFGLLGILAVVFAESGLLIGFFLPGDSLLFTAGFLASHPSSVPESLHLPLVPLLLIVWFGAVAGDQVGYLIGQRVGPSLFARPDSPVTRSARASLYSPNCSPGSNTARPAKNLNETVGDCAARCK